MRSVSIASIEVAADGRVAVVPATDDTGMFDYVYRAAAGVHWDATAKCFAPREVGSISPLQWFRTILQAVHSEFGLRLQLSPDTRWVSVSPQLRRQFESEASGEAA